MVAIILILVLLLGLTVAWLVKMLMNPNRRRIAVVSLLVLALLALSLGGWFLWQTTPTGLFRNYVMQPMHASVKVINSEYQGGRDPAVYLRFEASPQDMDLILAHRKYTTEARLPSPTASVPVWWVPQTLKSPVLYYWQEPHSHGDQPVNAAWLWVNETKTEAYFACWNF